MDASPPAPLGLPRARRIKQGRDFARVKTQGRRVVQGCLILNWVVLPASTPSRLGVITSRKVGQAVARSRARRLLREAFRLQQNRLARPVDAVLIARESIAGCNYARVEGDFVQALKRAHLYRDPQDGAETPTT